MSTKSTSTKPGPAKTGSIKISTTESTPTKVFSCNGVEDAKASHYASLIGVELCSAMPADNEAHTLVFDEDAAFLQYFDGRKSLKVKVDFVAGATAHRRSFGGGKGQQIAKAVGLNKGCYPSVLDCTAGLGGDAFVLATLGCKMTLMERSPIVHALLDDGLQRGRQYSLENDDSLSEILARMVLVEGDSHGYLASCAGEQGEKYDVVYLDPMFPMRSKSASVKKEMQAFHSIVGSDSDADTLLDLALEVAIYRVVVKRPRIAPFLAEREPSYQLLGKSSRFDIYTLKAFPK